MGMWGPGSDFYKIDVFLKMGDGARHFKNHPHNPPPTYVSMYCELSHGGGILGIEGGGRHLKNRPSIIPPSYVLNA